MPCQPVPDLASLFSTTCSPPPSGESPEPGGRTAPASTPSERPPLCRFRRRQRDTSPPRSRPPQNSSAVSVFADELDTVRLAGMLSRYFLPELVDFAHRLDRARAPPRHCGLVGEHGQNLGIQAAPVPHRVLPQHGINVLGNIPHRQVGQLTSDGKMISLPTSFCNHATRGATLRACGIGGELAVTALAACPGEGTAENAEESTPAVLRGQAAPPLAASA